MLCVRNTVRYSWCFCYEAKNQPMKRAAEASNYKDVAGTVVKYVSMQSAQRLKIGHMKHWLEE